ncbi:metallophosphoesterase [Halostella sp. JP-L12]|uniref:metallophosphoesterase n=1 Tax=Halostella TaxID=1843185 RepID=UPI000EF85072|nr:MULTISPECIES: metallophosphoesterase [Halostella]NHN46278.1 metallophosphoesterase [Halostella sp. JP-L12]
MIVVCSDTHSGTGHELTDHMADAVAAADLVLHAGDFTSEAALDAFRAESDRLFAVHGNADGSAVRERLPPARTVTAGNLTVALTHRRDGGATGLAMFGRSRGADLVVSGHTHRPSVTRAGDVTLLNPGSYADPRGNRPGYAELEPRDGGARGRLLEPDGTVVERFEVDAVGDAGSGE